MRSDMSDLMMKSEINLYDNFVETEGCNGRLNASFKLYPAPRIIWNYEALGEDACRPDKGPVDFKGISFRVENGYFTRETYGVGLGEPPGVSMSGFATRAYFGSLEGKYSSFRFYLPNCRFQQVNLVGQGHLTEFHRATIDGDSRDIGHGTAGRFIRAALGFGWNVHLETRKKALDWLDPNTLNIGTYITTVGSLNKDKENEKIKQPANSVENISVVEAKEDIRLLCRLLSFANGGWIGPLYVEGYHRNQDGFEIAGEYSVEQTTPLENIGQTWLTIDSSMTAFMECLPSLKAMIRNEEWREVYELALVWYFQAIQPQSLQVKGKPWPIIANALGALLERLCVMIVVKELGVRGLTDNKRKIIALLDAIGIKEDEKYVDDFIELRNDATHPTGNPQKSVKTLIMILDRATQWAEEALLWRLGYTGKYRDRRQTKYAATEPRYDISKRLGGW